MGRRYYSNKRKKRTEPSPLVVSNGTDPSRNSTPSNSNGGDPQSYQLWFLDSTKNDLVRYLNEYRQGCYEFYRNHLPSPVSGSRSRSVESNGSKKKAEKTKMNTSIRITDLQSTGKGNGNGNHQSTDTSTSVIGNIQFPPLNHELFQQPYLILPHTLSSKQRKVIHECCLQLDIYHDSVDDIIEHEPPHQQHHRVMVLSCYADGFQYLPPRFKGQIFSSESTSCSNTRTATTRKVIDLHMYRPWYCRRDNHHSSTTGPSNTDSVVPILDTNHDESHHPTTNEDDTVIATAGTPTKSNRSVRSFTNGSSTNTVHASLSMEKAVYTQQLRDQIWALLDQPGDCIRDTIDTISYEQLHQKTLANYNYQNIKTTPWTLVDTPYKMQQCLDDLKHPDITEIAFDLESYNVNASTQITCLIQITSNMKKEYVIDPLAPGVWDEIPQLQVIFGNPRIVKIGHAIASLDVPSLYRDFGIGIVNAFDTYEAAKCIPHIAPYGLAGLCQYYYMPHADTYQSLKDTYQNCNWRERPLTPDMMLYGRMDVHYLISLRQLLIRDMILSYNPLIWKTPLLSKKLVIDPSHDEAVAVVSNSEVVPSDGNMVDDEIVDAVDEPPLMVDPISNTTTDKVISNGHRHDEGDHTATSVGEDPFLSEVHYNKLIPSSSTKGPILTKNRDVFDFLSKISYAEDNYGNGIVDDDDQSYNTAVQSLTPRSSMNESFSRTPDSEALYNTCTEEEDEDDVLAEQDNEEPVYAEPKDITPEELRLQPIVMQCMSISQERCLNLWTDKKQEENYLLNDSYRSMLQKKSPTLNAGAMTTTKKKKMKMSKNQPKSIDIALPITDATTTSTIFDKEKDSFTALYVALVEWRKTVAAEILECLPGFVVSLEFLVNIAYKRPMTMAGLQLIAQQLPIALQQNETICNSLLDVVIQQTMVFQQLSVPTATIYYYSNLKLEETMNNKTNGTVSGAVTSNTLSDSIIVKVLIGASLGVGFSVSFYDVVKENPQAFNILPFVHLVQQRLPLYMNHVMEHQLPIVMNALRPYVPSYFVKK